jgi:hypothetical protein
MPWTYKKHKEPKFEVRAHGMQKVEGEKTERPVYSVVSKHEHYSLAHQYLQQHIGAEKHGLGANARWTKDKLIYVIHPLEKRKTKVSRQNDLFAKKKSIIKESILKTRLSEDSQRPDSAINDDGKAQRQAIAKPTKPDKPENKDTVAKESGEDEIIKGNKTLTGEKADVVNVEPELHHLPNSAGMKPTAEPVTVGQ